MRKTILVLAVCISFVAGSVVGAIIPRTQLFRYFTGWRPGAVVKSEAIGSEIVNALQDYSEANGLYPLRLDELMPNHADSIPAPVAGDRRWRYETDRAGTWFTLTFSLDDRDYPCSTYSSETGVWYEDT
jgi:hypothetical protein